MKKKISKKAVIIGASVLGALIIGGVGIWYGITGGVSDKDKVYVSSVGEITGVGSLSGLQNRYAGIVESQETTNIEKDSDTQVKEILVNVGDKVEVGTELFTYDVEELKTKLAEAQLALEKSQNEIESHKKQISELEAAKAGLSADAQFATTVEIQGLQTDIRTEEYNYATKQKEMESIQKSIDNATVKSEMEGVIKSINKGDSSEDMDSSGSFITILATGSYRIKGTVSEQNIYSMAEGDEVIVRSRVDDSVTWKGKIDKIDQDNKITSSGGMYDDASSDDSTNSASTKYPFYITLEDTEGLLMGQHVYIELNVGQTEEKEGIWLDAGFIVQEEDSAYVWVSNNKERLEKRVVTLGEFNEEMYTYQITDGLAIDDYIAYPMENLEEGMPTTTEIIVEETDIEDYEGGEMIDDMGEMPEDGEMIDEMPDEGEAAIEEDSSSNEKILEENPDSAEVSE